jgi:GNAT superfamily N-acetyltransferase
VQNLRIVSKPHAGEEEISFVREALIRHNIAATGETYYSPLAIFLRDERDAVLGGAIGHVWGGWLELAHLWVSEPLRGQGYGERLLLAAEEEARAHGCRGVSLTTFSFQARPFYEKFGYEVFGEIPDFPAGHAFYVLRKTLEEPSGG